MAIIKPFKGIRAKKEFVHLVASKPYDIITSDEARIEVKDNPYSFLHVLKAEIDLPKDIDKYDDIIYEKAKSNFQQLIDDGVLFQDSVDCLYVYQQKMNGNQQTGLMACSSLEDYSNDIIKKHEFTREEKEKDRIRHISTTDINSGPVFLTYPEVSEIDTIISLIKEGEPAYDFTSDDGIQHLFWVVEQSDINEKLVELFNNKVPNTYIADGHHRAASSSKVSEARKKSNANHTGNEHYNYFLSCLFPANQVNILAYNRVISDLNGMDVPAFIGKLEANFDVQLSSDPSATPKELHQIGMYVDGKWYDLIAKEGSFKSDDPIGVLDVNILHEKILNEVLGILDIRTDKRIDFVGGVKGRAELEKRVDSGQMKVAFDLYPVTIQQLINIADSAEVMPPKSTWFEPKLKSGIVVHKLS